LRRFLPEGDEEGRRGEEKVEGGEEKKVAGGGEVKEEK
jgi:hypothetical protein